MEPEILITAARVDAADGSSAVLIEYVPIGGGSQTVTVDGIPEERIHPKSFQYSVRLVSPDRTIPDELRDADSYEAACALAVKYANKRNEHAERVAELAEDLKI